MTERFRVRVPVEAVGEFSCPGSTFCADCYFGFRSTPRVTAVARKRSRSYCGRSAGGRLQLNTYAHDVCGFA